MSITLTAEDYLELLEIHYYVPRKMAPSLPATRMADEFGFPMDPQAKPATSPEDMVLIKGFLGNLKDQTLSRSTHRVLSDLLGRLP